MASQGSHQRLTELTEAGLILRDDAERYTLSDLGQTLGAAVEPLDAWARQWAATQPNSPRP